MEQAKKRSMEPKLVLLLIGLLALWLIFISIVPEEFKPAESSQKVIATFKATAGTETILNKTISVEKGTNAFEAMQSTATVSYQDYGSMGILVESINGKKPGQNQFWALYIDGEMATTGISSITIEKDTLIEWKTEDIEAYAS